MITIPKRVYFWWSASEVYSAQFVKWVIMRMQTGGSDTNKLGVGAIVESDWLFNRPVVETPPHGCKRGQYILRPYEELYTTYKTARQRIFKIKRPTIDEIRRFNEM